MAITPFYVMASASGSSDLNAGSTSADASGSNSPLVTYAGGTFVTGTGVFTVASGNPITDGVTAGMLVSVYTTAGATATKCVGVVSGVSATTITLDTTKIWGATTNVSATAAAATAKVGGAWATPAPLTTSGFGSVTVPLSTKVNIKAGTYTLTTGPTINLAGSVTVLCWFAGYNTTPGDLDNDTTNSLSKPVWALSSGNQLATSGAFQIWSSLSVTLDFPATGWSVGGSNIRWWRVRVENINTAANTTAVTNSANWTATACYFKAPTTATTNGTVNANGFGAFIGCVFEGGGRAGLAAGQTVWVVQCVCLNNTGVGILASSNSSIVVAFNSTFASPTADGIKWSMSTLSDGSLVVGCLFSNCPGVGLNNATGSGAGRVHRALNDFYNCGTTEAGFLDTPAPFGQTESSAVLTSSTDMTPVATSNARAHGFPGVFEKQTYSSGGSAIGAVDPAASAGGGETAAVFG